MVSVTFGKEPIENGRLRGDEISLTVGKSTYTGRVGRNRMRISATVDGAADTEAVAMPLRAEARREQNAALDLLERLVGPVQVLQERRLFG